VINAEQRAGREGMAAFFQGFAANGFEQCFAGFDVAGRLVQAHCAVFGALLDDEEAAVVFGDCGDS